MITDKPSTLGNPMSNAIVERIHQVLGNLVYTFNVDKNDPWTGILAAAAFEIRSTTSGQKCYSPVQSMFVRNMIIPIKYRVYWELIHQRKQMQNNRDNACKNKHRFDYDYKVGDKVMLTDYTAYKYKLVS